MAELGQRTDLPEDLATVLIIAGTNHLHRSDRQLEVARFGRVDVTELATAQVIDEQPAPIDHLPYERSGFDHRQSSCPDADTSPALNQLQTDMSVPARQWQAPSRSSVIVSLPGL